jgi:hypothetical protein
MAKKTWSDFSAGIRPRWEYGRIDSQAYQLGFETLDNLIIENGSARKRQGLVNSGTKDDGTAIVSHDALPFANGVGAFAWQVGYLYYLLNFFNAPGAPVRQDLSLSFTVGQFFHALGKVASFIDTSGTKRSVIINEDSSKTYSTTEFGLIVEAAGRRFFFNSPQVNAGFVAISFVGGVALAAVTLESYIDPGVKLQWDSGAGPGQVWASLNYDPNPSWSRYTDNAYVDTTYETTFIPTVIWWIRNGQYYSVATPAIGSTSQLQSAGDTRPQHTISTIATNNQQIDVRGSRSAPAYLIQLSADLIAGNTITSTINGDPSPVATAFATTHVAAMTDHAAALNADSTLQAAGISAYYPGYGRTILLFGPVVSGVSAVTGGASQATIPDVIVDQLKNFKYVDSTQATLIATDPIITTLKGYGFVRWVAWGNGLFMGTSRGVYEIVSGLGPGFSPLAGGFYTQEISNVGAMEIKHSKSLTQNQGHAVTKNCVVYVSDDDQVSILNRYTKKVNSVKLDLPDTHAIDSMAHFGGSKVAILCANVSTRANWNTATGYDASTNFICILDDQDGAYTKFPILAISIFGLDGKGLLVKWIDTLGVVQVGMIPWRTYLKYQTTPMPAATSYLDYKLSGASSAFTAKIVTLPIQIAGLSDIADHKNLERLVLRVKDTYSLSLGLKGKTLRDWDQTKPKYALALPSFYSGDIDEKVQSGNMTMPQVQIQDSSQYGMEVLAIMSQFTSDAEEGPVP